MNDITYESLKDTFKKISIIQCNELSNSPNKLKRRLNKTGIHYVAKVFEPQGWKFNSNKLVFVKEIKGAYT